MAVLKTKANDKNVQAFLDTIQNPQKKQDSLVIMQILQEKSGNEPIMWGNSIIGYGKYHYKYKTGREGDWMRIAFSPRKQNLTLYIMDGFETHKELLNKLGKFKIGKSCLYIKKLADIDNKILSQLVEQSLHNMNTRYPE
ncbi:hypothetical protein NEF87_000875 [Candidatus Lokiarchaeum ossiferum]|uniref:YdhG-like domain-containing protein n=1 Tax=Candidatus Lokiarchaeum ossiferum TaxID=2951803 RepID=A0ABY6HM51_9ARCH|nr:hypothetical protein NEF87_000875 [Candidatus Lokiarchaeum sp. B-35]